MFIGLCERHKESTVRSKEGNAINLFAILILFNNKEREKWKHFCMVASGNITTETFLSNILLFFLSTDLRIDVKSG